MTALSDIREAIATERSKPIEQLRYGRAPKLVVRVGESAALSIVAAMHFIQGKPKKLPAHIDDVLVETTNEFKGWELVRRG